MEKLIKKFLSGYGNGNGYGDGYGNGDGDGYGNGYGNGNGYGDGNGNGYGNGDGYGNGNGYGDGDGYGNGYGDGNGNGIKVSKYKSKKVYYVDNIPCVFRSVNKDLIYAKVEVINIKDFSSSLQVIYKFNGCLAHGNTLREAKRDAENKYYSQLNLPERINAFHKEFKKGVKYDASLFYKWHSTLTGSCQSGKDLWVSQHNFDMHSKLTVDQFIDLTKDSYGGEVIKQLTD